MGKVTPKNPENPTVDLKELSPEELKLAVNLFSIIWEKERARRLPKKYLAKAA